MLRKQIVTTTHSLDNVHSVLKKVYKIKFFRKVRENLDRFWNQCGHYKLNKWLKLS